MGWQTVQFDGWDGHERCTGALRAQCAASAEEPSPGGGQVSQPFLALNSVALVPIVVRPGATSSVLAPMSDAFVTSSDARNYRWRFYQGKLQTCSNLF